MSSRYEKAASFELSGKISVFQYPAQSRIMDSVISDAADLQLFRLKYPDLTEKPEPEKSSLRKASTTPVPQNHPFVAINCSELPENLLERNCSAM